MVKFFKWIWMQMRLVHYKQLGVAENHLREDALANRFAADCSKISENVVALRETANKYLYMANVIERKRRKLYPYLDLYKKTGSQPAKQSRKRAMATLNR